MTYRIRWRDMARIGPFSSTVFPQGRWRIHDQANLSSKRASLSWCRGSYWQSLGKLDSNVRHGAEGYRRRQLNEEPGKSNMRHTNSHTVRGGISIYGGSPSAISKAIIPTLQMSTTFENEEKIKTYLCSHTHHQWSPRGLPSTAYR